VAGAVSRYCSRRTTRREHSRFRAKISVGQASSTTLALVIHELATNSAKYGALSAARGTLDVSSNAHDDEVAVVWTERDGPPVMAPSMLEGFGSKLVNRTVAAQRAASSFDWSKEVWSSPCE
jgi:two-component sensor histidine kinase